MDAGKSFQTTAEGVCQVKPGRKVVVSTFGAPVGPRESGATPRGSSEENIHALESLEGCIVAASGSQNENLG